MDRREYLVNEICDELSRYLARNPDCADDAEGIRNWWLPPDLREGSTAVLIEALDRLVAQGLVAKRHLADGRVVYGSTSSGDRATH
jgi:hypothetical protein